MYSYERTAGHFDPSILGYRPEDLEEMSPDDKREALYECLMRAADLLEATTRAFDKDITSSEIGSIQQTAKDVIQIARRLDR